MDKQEAFNTVVAGLLNQGRKSVNAYGDCMYRGDYGCKCAAGHLIPDDKYDSKVEGYGIPLVFRKSYPKSVCDLLLNAVGISTREEAVFVRDLQRVHDKEDVKDWPLYFRVIAEEHGLSPAIIDTHSIFSEPK